MNEPKNQQLFRLMKDEKPAMYNEARNKHIKQVGKPWPLDLKTEDTGKGEAGKVETSDADEGKDKGEEKDVSIASQDGEDIYQGDEWQELSVLKEKHPVEYTLIVKESKVKAYLENPDTAYADKVEWIKEAINRIDAKVDVNGEGEGGIPNGM